jgi:hypothetical protein
LLSPPFLLRKSLQLFESDLLPQADHSPMHDRAEILTVSVAASAKLDERSEL